MSLHLGEIAQDDRWEKQRSGRMMALHRRSRAGSVPASLGKRVPQTRNAQLGLTMLTSESSRMNRQKVVLHRARAMSDKILPRRRSRVAPISWSEDDLKIAGSRKIVARGAMRSSSYRSDWQRLCLQPQEEGNLVPAFHTAAFTSRVRHGLPQRCDGQAHIFQRGHIAFQGL